MLLTEKKLCPEYHEHPFFNGQWHKAVWVKTWYSNDTNTEPPDEEIRESLYGEAFKDNMTVVVEPHIRSIAKAQLKKVVEWGEELCPHQLYPSTTLKKKWWCTNCRQDLLKEIE